NSPSSSAKSRSSPLPPSTALPTPTPPSTSPTIPKPRMYIRGCRRTNPRRSSPPSNTSTPIWFAPKNRSRDLLIGGDMNNIPAMNSATAGRRIPFTLILGVLWMLACEVLLFTDVHLSHRGRVGTTEERLALAPPTTHLGHLARWTAINMTALVCLGYLVLLDLGAFNWARSRNGFHMPHWGLWVSLLGGGAMLAWVVLARTQVTNYVLWTSLVFLLDPINYWLGRPSMFRDWERGWFGRTLAAFTGGLMCGFLWEFWNYWALTKWTYNLPFLGSIERYKYFEMPLPGLLGFLPFGIECWIMWQMIRIPLDGLAEPIPD